MHLTIQNRWGGQLCKSKTVVANDVTKAEICECIKNCQHLSIQIYIYIYIYKVYNIDIYIYIYIYIIS